MEFWVDKERPCSGAENKIAKVSHGVDGVDGCDHLVSFSLFGDT